MKENKAYSSEVLSVLAYECYTKDHAESERKIKHRLKDHNVGKCIHYCILCFALYNSSDFYYREWQNFFCKWSLFLGFYCNYNLHFQHVKNGQIFLYDSRS